MTTHKAHTNLFHNQCLALHALTMLMAINVEKTERRAKAQALFPRLYRYEIQFADWIYWHAARHVIPALFDGVDEAPMPRPEDAFRDLPKVIIASDDETMLPGGFEP
jgi:hypothetical protein